MKAPAVETVGKDGPARFPRARDFLSYAPRPQGCAHAALVLARDHWGREVRVEPSAAAGSADVIALFGPQDVPAVRWNPAASPPAPVMDQAADMPLLASRPRWWGDVVAVVVAESESMARAAAARTTLVSGERQDQPSRAVCRAEAGDHDGVSARVRSSETVHSLEVTAHAVAHMCLEPHACVAIPEPDHGVNIEIRTNTQAPAEVRRIVAETLRISMSAIRVRKYQEGGGFGAKQEVYFEPLMAWVAMQLGRPVSLRLDRIEDLAVTRTRHAARMSGSVGIDSQGNITGITLDGRAAGGAYLSHTPFVVGDLVSAPTYTYGDELYAGRCIGSVDPGRVPAGAYRGYGAPQATLLVEQLVEEAARSQGRDPLRYRIDQLTRTQGRPELFGEPSHQRLLRLLERTAAATGPLRAMEGGGVGVAVATMVNALGFDDMEEALCLVHVNSDGSVQVVSPASDCGTGSARTYQRLVAGVFRVPTRDVRVIEGDSDTSISDIGSYSQRSIYVGAGAVLAAAHEALERLRHEAAIELETVKEEVSIEEGAILRSSTGHTTVAQVARAALGRFGPIVGLGRHRPEAQSATYGVWVAYVEVSRRTGLVRPTRIVLGVDCGTPLSPTEVRGQLIGGVVQGLSNCLYEEGHPRPDVPCGSIGEHGVIRAEHAPPIEIILLDEPCPRGPGGAKGVGEIGIVGIGAAMCNAVANAIDWRPTTLPIRPRDVWEGIRE